MLIILQYPIYDLRRFQEKLDSVILKPNWNFLSDDDVNSLFVRTIGGIKERSLGKNEAGENYYSTAKKAIKFQSLPVFDFMGKGQTGFDKRYSIKIKPHFRRFFFDGLSAAKYEIGFSIDPKIQKQISWNNFKDFVTSLLNCNVEVPVYRKERYKIKLINAGRYLAEQYECGTTSNSRLTNITNLVSFGNPCILIERSEKENLIFSGKGVKLGTFESCCVNFFPFVFNGKTMRTYDLQITKNERYTLKVARELRISILKINAFRGALLNVLKSISGNVTLPSRGSLGAENLNLFLMNTFKYYLSADKKNNLLASTDNYEAALSFEDAITGSDRQRLYENLKSKIDIRGNYFKEISRFLKFQDTLSQLGDSSQITTITLDMTENQVNNYDNSGNSGNINTGINTGKMEVTNIHQNQLKDVDFDVLAKQLAELRQELKKQADGSIDHDIAISQIAQAENAAKSKDGVGVLKFLKTAGTWVLKVATDLGVSVAAKMIAHASGMA